MTNLSLLRVVEVSSNNLEGSLQFDFIYRMTLLGLGNNKFTGKIWDETYNVTQSTRALFDVSNNKFYGPLPDFTKFTNLRGFSF